MKTLYTLSVIICIQFNLLSQVNINSIGSTAGLNNTFVAKTEIKLTIWGGNNYPDTTRVYFIEGASPNIQLGEDSIKLFSNDPQVSSISSIADSTDLAINCFPSNVNEIIIPIRVKVGVTGKYIISADTNLGLPYNACVFLEDLATGDFINLRTSTSYSFGIADTTSAPRFLLRMSKPIVKSTVESGCSYKQNSQAIIQINSPSLWNSIWTDAIGNTLTEHSNNQGADTLKNLTPGIYHVLITGLTECSNLKDSIVIQQKAPISANTAVTDISCHGQNNGRINAGMVTGGTAPYNYKWSTNGTSPMLENLSPGYYSLIIGDAMGCYDTSYYFLKTLSNITAAFKIENDTNQLYMGQSITFTNKSIGGISYSWDFGNGTSTAADAVNIFSAPGTHTVSLISSDAFCQSKFQKTITIKGIAIANQVSIYNSEEEVTVKFNLSEPAPSIINVYTIEGKRISSQNFLPHSTAEKVQLGEAHGIYIVQVLINGEVFQNKVVK